MLRIADARVVQVAHVAPHLVKPSRLRLDAQQRTSRIVGTAKPLDTALCIFEGPFVVFHRGGHRDHRIVRVVAANEGDVGLLPFAKCLLQGSGPGTCLGKQQAPRGLEVETMDGGHTTADLVSDALQARLCPWVVRVSVHQQPGRFGNNNPVLGFIQDVKGWAGRHLGGVTRERTVSHRAGYFNPDGRSSLPDA